MFGAEWKFITYAGSCDCQEPLDLLVGSAVLTAVVKKVVIFWKIAKCSPYMNGRFGGTCPFHLQG
jgi:hypothetical protein